jgi:tRNA G18 (ribose-2'-O)-methylase SpoU
MPFTPVDSADDPRLDPFRRIKGRTDRHEETFVGESEIVLERLFASSIVVRSVLTTPARAARLHDEIAAYLARVPAAHEPDVFTAPQPVIDEVVGYPLHRGVIAVAERPVLPAALSLLSTAQTVVVLEGVMDPENVGSVFRHAAGFGADAVLLHGHTGDPLYRKTIRTSMGWTLSIPYARTEPGSSLTSLLTDAGFVSLALTPSRTADLLTTVIASLPPESKVALLLGAEGPGLEESTMASSHYRARIALSDGVDSLNVATTAALALFSLSTAHPNRLSTAGGPHLRFASNPDRES